jgi:hypothetical protein
LAIYYLSGLSELRADRRYSFEGKFEDAVLSNRFLVVLERFKFDTYKLSAEGYPLPRYASTHLGNHWVPKCLAIFDNESSVTIAVGGYVKNARLDGDIKVYFINESDAIEEFGRHDEGFRLAIETPLKSDYVRRIAFGPDGDRLVCVTKRSRVLVWPWLQSSPPPHPFRIERGFTPVR